MLVNISKPAGVAATLATTWAWKANTTNGLKGLQWDDVCCSWRSRTSLRLPLFFMLLLMQWSAMDCTWKICDNYRSHDGIFQYRLHCLVRCSAARATYCGPRDQILADEPLSPLTLTAAGHGCPPWSGINLMTYCTRRYPLFLDECISYASDGLYPYR